LPSFTISLLSEAEDPQGQYVGMDGLDYRDMPYPSPALEDFYPQEEFLGVVYGDPEAPTPRTVDGPSTTSEDLAHPLPRKNLHVQRGFDSEKRERMGHPARLYNKDQQRLSLKSVGDRVTIGVMVTTDSFEKTWVYYRLLRWVLRRFVGWFEANGLQNMTFGGADVRAAEELSPTASGAPVFQRQLTLTFYHEDYAVEVESVLRGWMLEIVMATARQDGQLDYTPIYSVSSGPLDDDE